MSNSSESYNNELFRLAFDNANIGMCLVDLNGKLFKVNAQMSKIFGYTIAELESMNLYDFTQPDYSEVSPEFINDTIHQDYTSSSFEKHFIHKNGNEILCKVTSSIVKNQNRRPNFFISHVQDITDQKRTEEKLKDAKTVAEKNVIKYRQIAEFTFDWEIYYDEHRKIQFVNKAFEKITGYPKSDFLSGAITLESMVYKDDLDIFMKQFKMGMEGIEVDSYLIRMVDATGKIKHIELCSQPVMNNNHEVIGIRKSLRDVSARKEAEKKLKESENTLRLITNNIPAIVGQINKESRYIFANKGYEKYSELNAHEIIGKSVIDVVGKETFKLVEPNIQRVLSGEHVSFDNKYINSDGEVFYLRSNYIPHIENNEVNGFYVLAWDITERKKKDQIILEQNKQLKELIASKDKFFSIIAHDLRNPFANIIGLSELLLKSNIDITQHSKFERMINTTAKNTLVLLDNLLNWSKSQTGKLEIVPKQIELSELLHEIKAISGPAAFIKGISLNTLISEEIKIHSDENMVKLILRNLISNAIKFTNPGGKIDVQVVKKSTLVELSVSDNGVGMEKDKLLKLFKIDSETQSVGTSNEKGSGLGLVLCKEFVEKLGGKIWVESEFGKGSDFKFSLPNYN